MIIKGFILNLLLLFISGNAFANKKLPVGSCIANKSMCNVYDKELDPWEQQCYTGAILKIEEVGKRSYKTICIESIAFCKEFVYFKDIQSDYFVIECPAKVLRLHNSIPLPRE